MIRRRLPHAIALAAGLAFVPWAGAREAPPPGDEPAEQTQGSELRDAYIKSKIVSAFAVNPHVSALDLDVKVTDGVAFLSGDVDDNVERDLAIEIAKGVADVRSVQSTIRVREQSSAKASGRRTVGETVDDATITAAVKGKLLANASTPGAHINVSTRRGIVTLTGTVDTDAQKDLAGRIAANQPNVAEVRNEITVTRQ